MASPVPLILDCDTGVDDTMAILLAALSPAAELVAVGTVWGNVEVTLATRNTLNVLAMCGRSEVPVAQGAAGPSDGSPAEYAYHVHGRDGQGNRGMAGRVGAPADVTAAEQIVRLCAQRRGEIELVPVGPLTNIAAALELDPDLPAKVRGITLMGGTALAPGNVSEVAEANIWHDPEAAATVFAAPWPITMVGLDVTMRTLLTPDHFARMRAGGAIAQYLAAISELYADFFAQTSFGRPLSCMHDAMAVGVAAGLVTPRLAPMVNVRVDAGQGPGRGQTLCDLRGQYQGYPPQAGAHCRVLLEAEPGFPDVFTDLITNAAP